LSSVSTSESERQEENEGQEKSRCTRRLYRGRVGDVVCDIAREHPPVYGESTGTGEEGSRMSVLSVRRFGKQGPGGNRHTERFQRGSPSL
jgi:hypothetical protein